MNDLKKRLKSLEKGYFEKPCVCPFIKRDGLWNGEFATLAEAKAATYAKLAGDKRRFISLVLCMSGGDGNPSAFAKKEPRSGEIPT